MQSILGPTPIVCTVRNARSSKRIAIARRLFYDARFEVNRENTMREGFAPAKMPAAMAAPISSGKQTMGAHDPRVDAYIAKSADFARPVLAYLRETVHGACPDVAENIKWSMPFFTWHGNLCHLAAFKAHCAFGFWRGKQIPGLASERSDEGMGNLGRIASLADLPSKRELTRLIKAAMKLNQSASVPERAKVAPKPALVLPDDLSRALKTNAKARSAFDAFSPSARREYIEWIVEAKRAETRASRLATAIEWISEGKSRHWKYQRGANA